MASTRSLKGKLLIAAPGLTDPNFARTVVFLAEHTEQGALGFVLNRPSDIPLGALWSTISPEGGGGEVAGAQVAFVGGPVQKNAVFVLHGHPDLQPDAEPVIPGVWLGSDVELFDRLMRRQDADDPAAPLRVFCGYSGWGAGQLDGELEQGGWLVADATSDLVFSPDTATLWNRALASLGGAYRFLALMPPHPEYN